MTAQEYLKQALALAPGLADHARIPGSSPPGPGDAEAWALLERAVSLEPANAAVHAARAALLLRGGRSDAARRAYALAARLDPLDAAAQLALGELAVMAGDEPAAQRCFDRAFARRRVYSPAPRAGARSALVLCVRGPWHRNIPLDFVVDPAQWALHRWYLPDDRRDEPLPPHDVVVNAIGESADAREALRAAAAFIAASPVPAINAPAAVPRTARRALAATLAGIPGCAAATVRRVARADLAATPAAFPLVVRPADAHGGRGLERIDERAALGAYADRVAAAAYDVGAFVDYRSADGYYRKYRVMLIGGRPYPSHLAVDASWMVHYHRAPMAAHAWMRAEEARFLAHPESAFPAWNAVFPAIARALGLDYFGIDCTVLADGTVFVFEADAAMLVHDFDPAPEKRAAANGIRAALGALLGAAPGVQPFAPGR